VAWNATPPNAALAVGAGLPAAWTQQVGADLSVLTGVWTAYTPVVGGYTSVVTATSGQYLAMGKTIFVRASVTISTVTTLGAVAIAVTLPFTSSATGVGALNIIGTANYKTNAGSYVMGHVGAGASSTTFFVRVATPAGATPNVVSWTGAAPAGQVAGDTWSFNLVYESA